MPDIINNVIQDYSASSHSIYVYELAPFKSTGLYIQQGKYLGGYRVAKNTAGTRSHLWDLYLLALGAAPVGYAGLYQTLIFNNINFYPIYCSTFTDNAGDNIYNPVPNFSGLSVLNHPVARNYQYNGSFSLNPIISTNLNQQYYGEVALYNASRFPLYPLLFCSSIPTHKSFGPAFLSSFDISVDGMDSLGDVIISCNMIGGRSIISPDNIPSYRPNMQGKIIKMKSLTEKADLNVEQNNFRDKYRSINLSDCAFYPDFFAGDNAFRNFGNAVQIAYSARQMPIYKIVSMRLNISQSIDLTYTYPGYSIKNLLIEFSDVVGPRFAALSNRKVTGSIKLFSPQNYSFINTNASSLTLYFGSVFFYTMKNVDWQQPVITINPGNGYFIEYNFTVRLTEITAFNGFGTSRVSEFF